MNIATSTALPSAPVATDASQDSQRAVPSDGSDVGDVPDAAATAGTGFGRILSQSIAKDGAAAVPPRTKNEATTSAATVASAPGDGTDPGAAIGAAKDARNDANATDPAVGDDLAAQLALVSQWAALAAQGGAPGKGAGAANDVDVRAKLETVRGSAAAQRSTPTTLDAEPATLAAVADDPTNRGPAVASLAVGALGRMFQPAAGAATRPALSVSADARAKAVADTGTDRIAPTGGTDATPIATTTATTATTVEQLFATVLATHSSTGGTATGADPAAALNAFVGSVASQASNVPQAAASTAGPADLTLHEAIGTPAWSHEVGQATLRMAANDLQNVSLRLNPEHLGPVDVQMRVTDGVAHLQFAAAHADTRSALEGSKSTLDQLFSSQGIKLGDWSVGQQSSNGTLARDGAPMRGDGGRRGPTQDGNGGDGAPVVATVTTRVTHAVGLVDTFA